MHVNQPQDQDCTIRIVVDLPRDIVEWIDAIADQMGFDNRGIVIAAMLRELSADLDESRDH